MSTRGTFGGENTVKNHEITTIAELAERVNKLEEDLATLKEAAQEHVRQTQARYRLAVKKAQAARKIEQKSGKLTHVLRTLYLEWQERRCRRQLVEVKQRLAKTSKTKPKPSADPKEDAVELPPPYVRTTETVPKGTLS